MYRAFNLLIVFLLSIATLGCASPRPPLDTPSGKPEIIIQGVSKKQVVDLLVNNKLAEGFQIKAVTSYALVIQRDIDDFNAQVIYGSDYDRTPAARVTYNFVDTQEGVRVFSKSEIITNPDSNYEKSSDATGVWGEHQQAELVRLRNSFK